LTDSVGIEAAQGFLHDFEGWVIFMACVLVLFAEMWLLSYVGKGDPRGWQMFDLNAGSLPEQSSVTQPLQKIPPAFVFSTLIVITTSLAGFFISEHPEQVPPRASLVTFPLTLGEWHGRPDNITQPVLDVLRLTDYLLANYVRVAGERVNLYVAYYENQRKGESPHSPRVCIPGGGWQITSLSREQLDLEQSDEPTLHFNRTLIKRGEQRQLVYYWFQQRGRLMANEYLVKWYLLVDALAKNRTDGALVRLVTPIDSREPIAAGDRRLRQF
ncbi:unnamed protein product, partial [marine sediment metagenome]